MSVTAESIQVENVVASSDIGQELDLETLSEDLGATDYDPDNFPGLVYRMHDPKAAALIFRSGKVVCTGAKSVDDVTTALEYIFDELRELGVDVASSPEIEIQNIVSSGDLDHTLNLNAIAIGLGLEHIEYDPNSFRGSSTGSTIQMSSRSSSVVVSSSSLAGSSLMTLKKPY